MFSCQLGATELRDEILILGALLENGNVRAFGESARAHVRVRGTRQPLARRSWMCLGWIIEFWRGLFAVFLMARNGISVLSSPSFVLGGNASPRRRYRSAIVSRSSNARVCVVGGSASALASVEPLSCLESDSMGPPIAASPDDRRATRGNRATVRPF